MAVDPHSSSETVSSTALRATAVEAALAAGPALRAAFRGGVSAREKSNAHDLVTDVDVATERTLADILRTAYPESTFWGEESTQGARPTESGKAPEKSALEWIVDPIDGTSNFVHGVALFSISIAATLNQQLVAGVVYDPIADLLFSADEHGAYLNGEPLPTVTQTPRADAALAQGSGVVLEPRSERSLSLFTDYPSAETIAEDGTLALEAFGDLVTTYATVRRPVSTAQSLVHLAAGWSDVWFGFGLKAWDVAAGAFIIQQAGGRFEAIRPADSSQYDDAHPLTAPAHYALGPGVESETARVWVARILEQRG
ncbi:inositol monophosphatase family protein [Neomicrococcus aestuarii]|uniref:inositol-phosphate phosphatase n=1 Tax=Neomicrococcus aestuarii TaxID=556325 RepID=A0A1L2ZMZ4_9MICC|nr:inositol monophosphatase family protein [Neomicrococcus aestuarii]APF40587.1 hypothetical protein BHE16_05650 [Neomicrococcus aestuarii]